MLLFFFSPLNFLHDVVFSSCTGVTLDSGYKGIHSQFFTPPLKFGALYKCSEKFEVYEFLVMSVPQQYNMDFCGIHIGNKKCYFGDTAVDTSQFKPAGEPRKDGPVTIVSLTRLVYRKGLDLIAAILPELCRQRPNVRVIICRDLYHHVSCHF